MKTILNFKSAKMLAICLTVLLVAGCDADDKRDFSANSKPCLDAGGVPIKSVWDYSIMTDCIFPPKGN